MIDDHVHGRVRIPGLRRLGAVQDERGEGVGPVGGVGFVVVALVFAEDAPYLGVDRGFDLAADLGGEPEPAGDHAVGIGPHPACALAVLAPGSFAGVLHLGSRRDTCVAQRDQAEFGGREELGFGFGVLGCGLGDHAGLTGGEATFAHGPIRLRQLFQAGGRVDRGADFAGRYAQRPRDRRRTIPIAAAAAPATRSRPCQHPVAQPANQSELLDRPSRVATGQRRRVELERNPSSVSRASANDVNMPRHYAEGETPNRRRTPETKADFDFRDNFWRRG